MGVRVLIMAGGTGGHIFPALAVAERLRGDGADVRWLGTRHGMEARIVAGAGIPMDVIAISGLRGKGLMGWLLLPLRMAYALLQSLSVIMQYRPLVVLGMGGFVSGPGAVMAWLLRIPLVIHEQNALAGLTNRVLSRLATRTLTGFPGTFAGRRNTVVTGNPVREAITALPPPQVRMEGREGPLHLLVLGGSQGAQAINEAVPCAMARLPEAQRPRIRHQAGERNLHAAQEQYDALGLEGEVTAFIDDMAAALGWADVVVCRAGALTIAELAAAGVAAVLIPYPFAVDDHQTHNARFLSDGGAAVLLPQRGTLCEELHGWFAELLAEAPRRRLLDMACAARRLARPDAARTVARICMEVAHG